MYADRDRLNAGTAQLGPGVKSPDAGGECGAPMPPRFGVGVGCHRNVPEKPSVIN